MAAEEFVGFEARRVTPQAELGEFDGAGMKLNVTRCVCGAEHDPPYVVLSYNNTKDPMPCCGARLIFRQQVTLLELVEPGEPITQPPDDHPIWQTPVAEAGPIEVTLLHMRDSMIEAGGTFQIHGYNADGNPLVDAAQADGVTLDEIAGHEQQESEP